MWLALNYVCSYRQSNHAVLRNENSAKYGWVIMHGSLDNWVEKRKLIQYEFVILPVKDTHCGSKTILRAL